MELKIREVEHYLEKREGGAVQIQRVQELEGEAKGPAALKQFGYGRPLLIDYIAGGRNVKVVIHRIRRNAFGREREEDRVAAVWLDFKTFNRLARHVPALDMIALTKEGEMESIGSANQLLLVTAYWPGHPYAEDLVRIRDQGNLQPLDLQRAEALASYLAEIHRVRHEDPLLWRRRLRDLLGHGEGIMGLTDSYAENSKYVSEAWLRSLEEAANRWRWRLKPKSSRLSQVHGDFHPFNVLFEEGLEFHLLDRSRGEWGEPGDDVSCMTINYVFFSLQRFGKLEGPFRDLHDLFWERYLALRPDEEMDTVIQPWLAWRALVLASPLWYPRISEEVRRRLLTFAAHVLSCDRYRPSGVNEYLEVAR